MAVYSLKAVQKIPADLPAVWSFFSNPANLKKITPAYMRFNVISKYNSDVIYAGQVIEYTVRPLLGIPLYWMTEITQVKDNQYFIDEQRYGPYSLWHHQHHFKIIDQGIEMTDIVHYKIPFWFLGDAANALFIRNQLKEIFSFRYQKTVDMLGEWPGESQLLAFGR
jgi:ligand-binding SRPBCC domain-containing protein